MPDLHGYRSFAEDLAREAGKLARKHFAHTIAFEAKDDATPVTIADIAINKLVIERCRQAFPDIGVLGEELSDDDDRGELLWVCDPIDGTTPFTLGMRASTFCLALVQKGEPIVGVVYDFMNERLFSAVKGGPALLNGDPVPRSKAEPLAVVELEWWHAAPHNLHGLHKRLFREKIHVMNVLSCSYACMLVATNRVRGVVYTGDKPWDVAAAKVIVEACGGKMVSLFGKDQCYDGLIDGAIVADAGYLPKLVGIVGEVIDA